MKILKFAISHAHYFLELAVKLPSRIGVSKLFLRRAKSEIRFDIVNQHYLEQERKIIQFKKDRN